MENNTQPTNKKCNCIAGHCEHCGWNGPRKHRIIVGIIVVLFAFWAGYKIGEMKGMMRTMYGEHSMMMYHGGYGYRGDSWNTGTTTLPPTPPAATPATPGTPANQ